MKYLLKELRILASGKDFDGDIRVHNGRIAELGQGLNRQNEVVLDCAGLFACPGLINAHDHLQFNLYPRLGDPPYENSYEWGADIRSRFRETVEKIERIPARTRYLWGAWKNLLSGVTYVVHHDPYSHHFRLFFPIGVLKHYTFAHSLGNEQDMTLRLAERRRDIPFVIHLAEGKDAVTATEVESLQLLGGLDERTVAVHAVNIGPEAIRAITESKCSVVWCPSSNYYLFGTTAPVESLWGQVPVALGTDSTLTGSVTMFDEMRCARGLCRRPPKEILQLVTDAPRTVFKLAPDAGQIMENGTADFFLLPLNSADPYELILTAKSADIALLMRRGRVVFSDDVFFPSLRNKSVSMFFSGKSKTFASRQCVTLSRELRGFLGHYEYLNAH